MKLSGSQFLGVLSDYFNYGEPTLRAMDVFWFLLLPGLLLTIFLFFYSKGEGKHSVDGNVFSTLKEEDYELFDSIRLQKGLEVFDRDFIVALCEEHKIEAVKVLLDKTLFEKLENSLRLKAEKRGLDPENENSVIHLRKLKRKLYIEKNRLSI